MKCLEDGKVCMIKKKCKDCVFDDCRKTLEVLEEMKKKKEDTRLKSIKRQLADSCKNCKMLQILDIDKQKLYCPYLVKKRVPNWKLRNKGEKKMINFILIMIAIILSPLLIICAFISLALIACIMIAIASVIAESIRKLIDKILK